MDSLPNLSTVIHKETKQIREEAARKEENDTTVSYRERAPPKKAIRRPAAEARHTYIIYTCGPIVIRDLLIPKTYPISYT